MTESLNNEIGQNSMSYRVLFLEPLEYYAGLGFKLNFGEELSADFNGLSFFGSYLSNKLAPYDAVICSTYHSELANYIINEANILGIRTVLIADGIFEWGNAILHPVLQKKSLTLYHPIIHDSFICIGKREKEYFESAQVNCINYMPRRVINNYKKIALPEKACFLITTANTPYFNDKEFEFIVQIILDITKTMRALDIEFQFRIFDKRLLKSLSIPDNKNDIKSDFESALHKYTAVITTPSSISISCMYHERTVAQMLYRDTPMLIQTGWSVFPSSDYKATILSMIDKPTERMRFQNYMVAQYTDEETTNELEPAILQALQAEKLQFGASTKDKLLESRFNFNIEYTLRKLAERAKKSRPLSKIYLLIKALINRTSI